MMKGIQNFLNFLYNNWTSFTIIVGLFLMLAQKCRNYLCKSDEEKIAIAKEQIRQVILKMVTDAELDYEAWREAGSIKRAQVIQEIFEKYPILSKVLDQNDLIQWIDETIDQALETMREVIEKNTDEDDAENAQ